MLVSSQGFHAPKRGNAASEYEDAFFPEHACERRPTSEFHCAVADGASDSAFSREWARLLVRWYHYRLFSLGLVHRCWLRKVNLKPVPWYLEEKIRRGAHATLVGLSIRDSDPTESHGGDWEATAVGDSCLFHVRDDELLSVAPITKSDAFNNHPHLVSTDSSRSFGLNNSRLKVTTGKWQPSDVFYLLTDALAEWTLSKHEEGQAPWSLFRCLGHNGDSKAEGQNSFEALVANLREHGGLHNDDTTMLRIEVS
jgi:serine/threonine protein phosphatase PrpC